MLFDLSSPGRKRVIRVVYGVLALLFAVGFVGFGIGTDQGIGGLFDSITGGGGSSTAEQYEQQIEDAEAKLEENPNDSRALQEVALYRALSGRDQLEVDEETGAPALTDESREEYEAAIDAWDRYIATDPAKPDVATASAITEAFVLLNDAGAAADAAQVLADENPAVSTIGAVAQYRYYDLDVKGGDKAVAELKKLDRGPVEATVKQFEKLREQVIKEKKRLAKLPESEAGESQLENPFGGLGGSTALPPTAP
jgi:tetratricopeptide (TPR) repeat protein